MKPAPCKRLVDRWLIPHPFSCDRAMCRNVIAHHAPDAQTPGVCDEHPRRGFTVPIAIFGYGGQGWCAWPLGVAHWAALEVRGAFRHDGTTKPVGEWFIPPDD